MSTRFRGRQAAAILAALLTTVACGQQKPSEPAPGVGASTPAEAARPSPSGRPRVVFLGDSLTAGQGLDLSQAYPALIEDRLRDAGLGVDVVNAGVSGDTSAGGLRRLDWSLEGRVAVLVVALGGNDALRGLGPEDLRQNLAAILERARQRNVPVVLAGMEAPPNLGPAYTSAFRQVYRDLADQYGVAFIPFLLEGVAGHPALNQADLIHPNAEGARKMADLVWPFVERAVREALAHD